MNEEQSEGDDREDKANEQNVLEIEWWDEKQGRKPESENEEITKIITSRLKSNKSPG